MKIISCYPWVAVFFFVSVTINFAETIVESPNIYKIDEGVDFELGNNGSTDFTFNWTDPSAPFDSFSNVSDPTLILTVGETYTFQRITGAHPFVIMDDTIGNSMSGTDGNYSRITFSGAEIDNATLSPIASFTADPAPTSDLITWTPMTTGDYWYTCRVTSHTGMSGRIQVVSNSQEIPPDADVEVINVSTRGFLNSGPGNEFNLGFQISGNAPLTVVIRVTGEDTLRSVFDAALGGDSSNISLVQDPNMTLRRTDVSPPIVVAQQDDWEELTADLLDLLAGTAFDPVTGNNTIGTTECVMPITLEPGNYTVQVFGGGDDDNGVVLGEVNSISE